MNICSAAAVTRPRYSLGRDRSRALPPVGIDFQFVVVCYLSKGLDDQLDRPVPFLRLNSIKHVLKLYDDVVEISIQKIGKRKKKMKEEKEEMA